VAQKVETRDERPLQSFSFKNFLAVNTTNQRTGLPNEAFANLENAQPIGAANIHSIADISGLLHNYGADTIYTDINANIGNVEYLIQAATNGKLFSYNVGNTTVTQINGAILLAGSATAMTQWQNTNVLIVDSTGYYQWNGAGNIAAITGTGAPTSGNAIAVYQNRAWIAQGRILYYSAPGSFSDFTTASGGGFTVLVDSTLRSNIQQLLSANGYLYIFGVTSVDQISDLYIPAGASPPTPNFTKLNVSPSIGTDQIYSIVSYGRLVLFANRWGIWRLYGTSIDPISGVDPNNSYQSSIDGTMQYAAFNPTMSAALTVSRQLLCAGFLLKRNADPTYGSNTVIAMYQGNPAGGRWWFANYGTVTRIATAFVNNQYAMFAYIGNSMYQLFANLGSSPPAIVSTALWDFGDPITQKECIRGGIGLSATGSASVTLNLDTPQSTYPFTVSVVGQVQWINNLGATVTWVNNAAQVVQWAPGQFQTYWAAAPRGFAKYVGFTLNTAQGTVFELNSFLLDYKWGARWVGN
jgi:hypothetical protein